MATRRGGRRGTGNVAPVSARREMDASAERRRAQRRLRAAYRATVYRVQAPHGVIDIRIGERHAALDALLAAHAARHWLWITAFNPASRRLSDSANEARHRRLLEALRSRRLPSYPATAIALAGDWPPERGVLVLGAGVGEGLELAARFGQHAIVCGRAGGVARLRWR